MTRRGGRERETPTRTATPAPRRSPAQHLVVLGEHVYASHPLPETGAVTIGRAPRCDIAVPDESISRRHATLHVGERLTLEDLGSANGTRVQGRRLAPGESAAVAAGEAFQLGTIMAVVRAADAPFRPRRLWPHGYFEGRLDEECDVNARSRATFAVARIRAEGELDGATVLDALTGVLRAGDVVGQYTQGEFELLLRGVSPEHATRVVARIPKAFAAAGVTVVIGHACFPRDGRTAAELLAAAASAAGADNTRAAPPEGAMADVRRMADRVAASSLSVLILGETGVGKELLAEYIHQRSPRHDRPLLRLNCAALAPTLLESELFGHERGAFTGADRPKPGLLEGANGGSVFLDEIGELPEPLQVKLLRVIEDRKVQRVGGLTPREINVRFIAATNRNLEEEVARGRFRRDLLYRINAMTLVIPPLRQRLREIEPLARGFADEIARELGRPELDLAPDALDVLRRYAWPGNIRELRNVVMRAAIMCGDSTIRVEHLPREVSQRGGEDTPTRDRPARPAARPGSIRDSVRSTVAQVEKAAILEALAASGGNQHEAASRLGIHRRTLMRRLDEYGIPRPRKRRL
jgi:DNA-binding NtrC family response regulator